MWDSNLQRLSHAFGKGNGHVGKGDKFLPSKKKKFFRFKVDSFSEGYGCTGKQTESQKGRNLPNWNGENSILIIHSPETLHTMYSRGQVSYFWGFFVFVCLFLLLFPSNFISYCKRYAFRCFSWPPKYISIFVFNGYMKTCVWKLRQRCSDKLSW